MNETESSGTSTVDPQHAPRTPAVPDYPHTSEWIIDMNYLMPFSVMLMILCVLLLILCYLRHRMRQRRQLRHELQLRHILRSSSTRQPLDEFGVPMMPDRLLMMYPPTYDEATHQHQESMHKASLGESPDQPPPYSELRQSWGHASCDDTSVAAEGGTASGHTQP